MGFTNPSLKKKKNRTDKLLFCNPIGGEWVKLNSYTTLVTILKKKYTNQVYYNTIKTYLWKNLPFLY